MRFTKITASLLLFLGFFLLPSPVSAEDASSAIDDDPMYEQVQKHTREEFDALSDEEKRAVYFDRSELLPDDFDPTRYWDILHGEDESGPQE